MNIKAFPVASLCLALAAPTLAAPTSPSASGIIQKEGRLVFTDGSSFYDFEKNGTFRSGPTGLCGRTIDGRWKPKDSSSPDTFVVRGIWGWMNGVSAINDYREMTLSIYAMSLEPKKTGHEVWIPAASGAAEKMYRCRFVAQKSIKLPRSLEEQLHVRASAVSRPVVCGL